MMKTKASTLSISWDYVGVLLSFLCLVHCMLLPFVIVMLPALSLEFLKDEIFHKVLAVILSLVSVLAFIPGLRLHNKKIVILFAVMGLVCIQVAVFYVCGDCNSFAERGLTSLGGLLLIAAHLMNHTFCLSCLKCRNSLEDSCVV